MSETKKKKYIGFAFLLLGIMIVSVSAYVYESGLQTVNQTIINVATLTLKNSDLGNLEEGSTNSYTKANVSTPNLGSAISLTTGKAGVYLHLNSTLDLLSTNYDTYNITVRCFTVPPGSLQHAVGQAVTTMTILAPDPSAIYLDVGGSWVFDFEIITTAKSVSADQPSTVTIVVTAEST